MRKILETLDARGLEAAREEMKVISAHRSSEAPIAAERQKQADERSLQNNDA